MSRASQRTLTASLILAAGVALVVALLLPGGEPAEALPKKVTVTPNPPQKTPPNPAKVVKKTVVAPAPEQPKPATEKPVPPPEPPKVDVVFALDTTGSMGGLLAGAKRKIWSIATQIASGQPRPDVRLGLVAYRDVGDAYVTRRYALTENVDDIYARLKRLRADGGGDTPEHVNRALHQAIHKIKWRQGDKVLRLIFLVGDAPPHEGRGGLRSRTLAAQAADRGIIINAVRCGSMGATARAWKRIAAASGGVYASIRQDGGMVAHRTPVDEEMKKLNVELSRTLLPAGSEGERAAAKDRARRNMAMMSAVQAESAAYRATSGKLDNSDLLDKLAKGADLDRMSAEELPPALASMPAEKRKAYVAEVKKKRSAIKARIKTLHAKRKAYIRARRPASAPKNAFDDVLGGALKEQGKRIDLAY